MTLTKREKIGLLIIIILLLVLSVTIWYGKTKNDNLNIANHNITALQDTITKYELKNKELLFFTNSLVIEKNELEKYLEISKREVKDLEKKLDSKLLYISQLEAQSNIDTIYMETQTTKDSLYYRYSFEKIDPFYTIKGYTDVNIINNIGLTTITENSMKLNLKVGLSEDWKIFVTTDNPYITFNNIEGALLDKNMFLKEQKIDRFSLGIQFGFGGHYGLVHNHFDYGPYLGIGVEYRLFSW